MTVRRAINNPRAIARLKGLLLFQKNFTFISLSFLVIGGLLSAHLLQYRATYNLDLGWPCEGRLLDLARKAAEKLLPG